MKKKQKKQSKYILRNKEFTTFKEMKTYAYFNMGVGTKEEAIEISEDEIQKHYIFIKKERKLLCNIIYNKEKVYKEWCEHLQLKLFEDG